MENYISREDRLGKVFNKDNIEKLNTLLNELELPHIPYDISLEEIRTLLSYHGNMLAYLYANLEIINVNETKQISKKNEIYNKVYSEIQKQNTDNKVTTVKNIALKNQKVLEAENILLNIKTTQAKINASIKAFEQQNICLRKIATIKGIEIENGL